jgi:hypothetical protein
VERIAELEARVEQLGQDNAKLRQAITNFVDLSWVEEGGG